MTQQPQSTVDIDVVVPTYRRPAALARCLDALAQQVIAPAGVVIVVRRDDQESQDLLAVAKGRLHNLRVVEIDGPGVVGAMSAGVAATTSEVVAFTDDDAQPRADWILRLSQMFRDPTVGGVGGRDNVAGEPDPTQPIVGTFSRSGRPVGNHHLGTGPPRDALFLKGVNFAFRAEALAMPRPGLLRGSGAQVDFEVLMCGWALSQGWRLVYDPDLLVDHFPARRLDSDQRGRPDMKATFNAAYNAELATALGRLAHRHPERIMYPILVGGRDRPGIVRAAVAILRGEPRVLSRAGAAIAGHLLAVCLLPLLLRRPATVPASTLRGTAFRLE